MIINDYRNHLKQYYEETFKKKNCFIVNFVSNNTNLIKHLKLSSERFLYTFVKMVLIFNLSKIDQCFT